MNTEELIELLHQSHAAERQKEKTKHLQFRPWWLAVPAAAAVILLLLLPKQGEAKPQATTGTQVYCNSSCNPDDVMALIQEDITHIQQNL
ncbi:MAG: hypothetical protein IKP34_03020 [Bacteroidales bacterium]|nr:hypothetical protein [Bacteroidales bacterium]